MLGIGEAKALTHYAMNTIRGHEIGGIFMILTVLIMVLVHGGLLTDVLYPNFYVLIQNVL